MLSFSRFGNLAFNAFETRFGSGSWERFWFEVRRYIIWLSLAALLFLSIRSILSWSWQTVLGFAVFFAVFSFDLIKGVVNKAIGGWLNNALSLQLVFEISLFSNRIKNELSKLVPFVKRTAMSFLPFWVVGYIYLNGSVALDIFDVSSKVGLLSAITQHYRNLQFINGFYLGLLIILWLLIAQHLPVFFSKWKQNSAPIMFAGILGLSIFGGIELATGGRVTFNPDGMFMLTLIWTIGVTEILLFHHLTIAEKKKNLDDLFKINYAISGSLFGDTQKTHFDFFREWKIKLKEISFEGGVPYIIDSPILNSKDDKLGYKKFAGDIFEYIRWSELPGSSIVIGIEGDRGSGKTSVTNILKSDYLNYLSEEIPIFSFNVWSHGGGDITVSFLKDFRSFCILNGIRVDHGINSYIETFSKTFSWFSLFDLFFPKKTEEDMCRKISEEIRKSGKRIVVFFDDLDRITEKSDFESVLKLLRSTANFYGTFYVMNYSLKTLKDSFTGTFPEDFEKKFLSFKFEMPSSGVLWRVAGSNRSELGKLLIELLLPRATIMVERMIATGKFDFIQHPVAPGVREPSAESLRSFRTDAVIQYLRVGIQRYSLSLESKILYGDMEYVKSFQTPRFVKFIINEILKMLRKQDGIIEAFRKDWLIVSEESGYAPSLEGLIQEIMPPQLTGNH